MAFQNIWRDMSLNQWFSIPREKELNMDWNMFYSIAELVRIGVDGAFYEAHDT